MGGYVGLAPAGFPNVALSNYAKEFADDAVPLVGDLICPKVPVERQSFPFVIWNRDNLRIPGSTLRAPSDGATTIRRSFSTNSYFARSHALKGSVPFESEAYGLGLGFSEKLHLTGDLIGRIRRARESEITKMALSATNFPNGVIYTTSSTPAQWDSYITNPSDDTEATVTSHPIVDVETYKAILRQAAVQDSEMVLILSDPVVTALVNHPDIINRFKYTNLGGQISLDQLTSVFGVKCVRASALTMSQNNVASWIWGYNAFLGMAKSSPDRNDVSCMKTFVWAGGKGPGAGGENVALPGAPGTIDGYGVLEWLDPELDKKTYWQSVDWYYDIQVTAVETGIPLINVVDSANFTMGTIPGDIES
jgi:hypothetical protein